MNHIKRFFLLLLHLFLSLCKHLRCRRMMSSSCYVAEYAEYDYDKHRAGVYSFFSPSSSVRLFVCVRVCPPVCVDEPQPSSASPKNGCCLFLRARARVRVVSCHLCALACMVFEQTHMRTRALTAHSSTHRRRNKVRSSFCGGEAWSVPQSATQAEHMHVQIYEQICTRASVM